MATRAGTRDQREVVAAIHGRPLPEGVAKKSMLLLEERIKAQFERRRERFQRSLEAQARILAPLRELIESDAEAAEAVRARRVPAPRRPAQRAAIEVPHVEPQLHAGSIITVASTPYPVDWSSGSGSSGGQPGGGGGFGEKSEGRFGASASTFGSNNNWGAGGVAAQLQPIADNVLLRFSPFVRYTYNWEDASSWGSTAHNDGYLNLFITSFALDGSDQRVEIDQRAQMWSDGTGWFEDHHDDGDRDWGPQQLFLPVTSARVYLFWVWSQDFADSGSDASSEGNLDGTVPFMVFEQFT